MFCSVLKKKSMNSGSNEIQQNLQRNIKKGDILPIIITHVQSFVKGHKQC